MTTNLKGIFIPIEILCDNNLSIQEKLVLSLVKIMPNALTMSNARIGELINLSKSRVSEICSSLASKGYIDVKLIYKPHSKQVEERHITIKKAIEKVQEVVKNIKEKCIGGKNKTIKQQQGYTTTTTTVGTEKIQQVTFNNGWSKKKTWQDRIYTHDWDLDELERLADEQMIREVEEYRRERCK